MSNIKILDCTLRDGGYVNNWNFGQNNIKAINDNLALSNVDYIELGYLTNKKTYDDNYTCFNSLQSCAPYTTDSSKKYLCMINFGEYKIEDIPMASETNIYGIRIAFHKKDMIEALKFSNEVKAKGYSVFVQPMLTMSYSDEELRYFLQAVNEINPYALYLVDSFGYMTENDIKDKLSIILESLNQEIIVGFHSHNNLQLAFSNTIAFINGVSNRKIIIDSSIYGMGRGAGNLNTELIMQHLNENYGTDYQIQPLLCVVDEILEKIKSEKQWGYSLIYYLSAVHKCHPNYAKFYNDRSTLLVSDIGKILDLISDEKKSKFDEEYAQELYEIHLSGKCDDQHSYKILNDIIGDRDVLLVGSGSSTNVMTEEIKKIIEKNNLFVILVNNCNDVIESDATFVSNRKRYDNMRENINNQLLITTSNIVSDNCACTFDYRANLARELKVSDNALLLMINILKKMGRETIYLAGFDGYNLNSDENYYDSKLSYVIDKNRVNYLNSIMKEYINLYKNDMTLRFVTPSLYTETDVVELPGKQRVK